jgi:excinuclease UvrABC nuclease subunit
MLISFNEILIFYASFPIIYHNADLQKREIYLNCKNKSGIYMWLNNINGKRYIGSSIDLKRRISSYYSVGYLTTYDTSMINRALLKYGYSSFSLHIIEYCESKDIVEREQYYIDFYKPEYNILKKAYSSLGLKKTNDSVLKNILAQPNLLKITVIDIETNVITRYISMGEAARALGINDTVITKYFKRNQKKPYKKKYIFKLGWDEK